MYLIACWLEGSGQAPFKLYNGNEVQDGGINSEPAAALHNQVSITFPGSNTTRSKESALALLRGARDAERKNMQLRLIFSASFTLPLLRRGCPSSNQSDMCHDTSCHMH